MERPAPLARSDPTDPNGTQHPPLQLVPPAAETTLAQLRALMALLMLLGSAVPLAVWAAKASAVLDFAVGVALVITTLAVIALTAQDFLNGSGVSHLPSDQQRRWGTAPAGSARAIAFLRLVSIGGFGWLSISQDRRGWLGVHLAVWGALELVAWAWTPQVRRLMPDGTAGVYVGPSTIRIVVAGWDSFMFGEFSGNRWQGPAYRVAWWTLLVSALLLVTTLFSVDPLGAVGAAGHTKTGAATTAAAVAVSGANVPADAPDIPAAQGTLAAESICGAPLPETPGLAKAARDRLVLLWNQASVPLIGCGRGEITAINGLIVIPMHGGDLDPAALVSGTGPRALPAYVPEQHMPLLDRLVAAGTLVGVDPLVQGGVSELQPMQTTQGCEISFRQYGRPETTQVGGQAAALLLRLALYLDGTVTSIERADLPKRRHTYTVAYAANGRTHHVVISVSSTSSTAAVTSPAWLKRAVSATCPSTAERARLAVSAARLP